MKKANLTDKPLVVKLLAASFDQNPSINYIIQQDKNRKERICALMDYAFEVCYRFGEIYLSGDHKACALLLYTNQKRTTLKSIWLDVKLIIQAIGFSGIKKTLKREAMIKERQPKVAFAYLWFIGVSPLYQHQGIGSKLMQGVMERVAKLNLPVVLETSVEQNLSWYGRFGLRVYDTLKLDYTLYFLGNL